MIGIRVLLRDYSDKSSWREKLIVGQSARWGGVVVSSWKGHQEEEAVDWTVIRLDRVEWLFHSGMAIWRKKMIIGQLACWGGVVVSFWNGHLGKEDDDWTTGTLGVQWSFHSGKASWTKKLIIR